MFVIYLDDKLLYAPGHPQRQVFNAKLTLEMGKAGSLEFDLPPEHPLYAEIVRLRMGISVKLDDTEIFRGRVLSTERAFNNVKTVYCEGDLAYLVDSVQRLEKYDGTVHDLFAKIVEKHNARMTPDKQFKMGNITVDDWEVHISGQDDSEKTTPGGDKGDGKGEEKKFNYHQIALNATVNDWKTTFDYLSSYLIDYVGGYLRTRHEADGVYLDYLKDFGHETTQPIRFGTNLLDLKEEITAEDLFTVLVPLGDENLTIADVNNGSDELIDADAVSQFGRIVRTHVFDNVNKPETLLENGQRYLEANANIPITLTISAIDLHLLNPSIQEILLGDSVPMQSAPHGLVDRLTCSKIEYDLQNPENTVYTFGVPRQSLTQQYREDATKNNEHSGGGGGGGAVGEALAEEEEEKRKVLADEFIDKYEGTVQIWAGKLDEAGNVVQRAIIELDGQQETLKLMAGEMQKVRIELDGLNDKLTLTAGTIDLVTQTINTTAETVNFLSDQVEINAHNITLNAEKIEANFEELSLKASKDDVDALTGRMATCESEISQTAEEIKLRVTKTEFDELGNRVGETESSIQVLSDSITSKVSQSAFDELGNRVTTAESAIQQTANEIKSTVRKGEIISTINQSAEAVTISASKINLEGYVTASELEAERARFDNLISGNTTASFLSTTGLTAEHIQTTGNVTIGGDLTISGFNFKVHRHMIIDNGDGSFSIGNPAWNGVNSFNIADTKTYKDGVSAAASTVTLDGSWSGGVYTVEASNNKSVSTYLSSTMSSSGVSYNKSTHKYDINLPIYYTYSGSSYTYSTGQSIKGSSDTDAYEAGKADGKAEGGGTATTAYVRLEGTNDTQFNAQAYKDASYSQTLGSATRGYLYTTGTQSNTVVHVGRTSNGNTVAQISVGSLYTEGYNAGKSAGGATTAYVRLSGTNQTTFSAQAYKDESYSQTLGSSTTGYLYTAGSKSSMVVHVGRRSGGDPVAQIGVGSLYNDGFNDGWNGVINSITYDTITGSYNSSDKTYSVSVPVLINKVPAVTLSGKISALDAYNAGKAEAPTIGTLWWYSEAAGSFSAILYKGASTTSGIEKQLTARIKLPDSYSSSCSVRVEDYTSGSLISTLNVGPVYDAGASDVKVSSVSLTNVAPTPTQPGKGGIYIKVVLSNDRQYTDTRYYTWVSH